MTGRARQRLLVVEDDPEIQYLLSVVLAADDREVIVVETGAEASKILEAGDIDLVILDLILPDVDGRSLLSQMRGRPETANVPVVVVTARSGAEIRRDCYALGADAFAEKPFDAAEFAADITVRLERAAQAEKLALSDSLTGLLNRAGLQAACAEASGGYALALIEIDGFDEQSERWGWDNTERVVKDIAGALRSKIQGDVMTARIGGGEFALMMPGVDLASASRVAVSALEIVKSLPLEGFEPGVSPLTAKIGVLTTEGDIPLEDSLEVARQRIFRAREVEGGQVVSEDVDPRAVATRVLVAEDDEISATILIHRLEKEGLEVVRFDNGEEAYEAALAETPDLVILDVKMPGLDGFEVLERLRKNPRYTKIPIIMLTSMGQEADVVRGFRLGADDYVLKPFSPTELSARVRRLLRRGRSPSAV